jgi:hypothetical protein
MKRKIIIKRGEGNYADQFYATIVADNGETLAHTEHRARKSALKKTMKKYFPGFKIVEGL